MSLDILIPVITTVIGSITTLFVIWYKHRLSIQASLKKEGPIEKCVGEDVEIV